MFLLFLSITLRSSCAEPHFRCKYRHNSEILQTFLSVFLKNRLKIEQNSSIRRYFNEFGWFFALFTWFYCHRRMIFYLYC